MIDKNYECDWYIEDVDTGVKTFNGTELKSVYKLPVISISRFYWVKGLLKLLKKDYDVYFMLGATSNVSLFVFSILKSILYPRKRIYLWTHGYYGKESWIEKFFWKRPMLKMTDGVFTYGDYARRLMIEDGFDKSRLFPIHNSLDYDEQLQIRKQIKVSNIYKDHFGNENPVIIFIGRLTVVKKLDMLIDALHKLRAKGESYNLVFVGDGVEGEKLKNLVEKYDLNKQVWFIGECYSEKTNAELIYNADLCVAPGNIGLTAMHVLMFGCPAISHNDFTMQMPEFESIKPGVTGDFFVYGNTESLALTISKWFEINQANRELIRENCYKEIDDNWNPYYQMKLIKNHLL